MITSDKRVGEDRLQPIAHFDADLVFGGRDDEAARHC